MPTVEAARSLVRSAAVVEYADTRQGRGHTASVALDVALGIYVDAVKDAERAALRDVPTATETTLTHPMCISTAVPVLAADESPNIDSATPEVEKAQERAFAVGDRVRSTTGTALGDRYPSDTLQAGYVGKIAGPPANGNPYVAFERPGRSDMHLYVRPNEIEHIDAPTETPETATARPWAIGDRVKTSDGRLGTLYKNRLAADGLIDDDGDLYVDVDGGGWKYCRPEYLTRV